MKSRLHLCLALLCLSSSFAVDLTPAAEDQSWPPALPGAKEGTVTLTTDKFLQIPASCAAKMKEPGAAPFTVAKTAPTVDFAYHGSLPNQALNGTGWSAWGDIAVASTGMVYCGIGDHGEDNKGKSHAYLYAWNPKTNTLKQIIDVNAIVTRTKGEPTWSKVHAGILEGPDGNIYFSATLNDGNSANQPVNKWSEAIPGGQLYQYNPRSGKSKVFANLPAGHCTATTRLDTARYVWWCNLESSTLGDKIQAVNELYAVNLKTGKPLYRAPDGSVTQNRNFALARNGTVYFNGEGGIWKCDAQAKKIEPT
ncbi:MAG: hypothetical protein ABI443_02215, partial [Chthoniobacterales bacterium]